MSHEVLVLMGSAVWFGFGHTIIGPDHYVPFVFMSQARNWNTTKTLVITAICGLGHVLSSVALGFIGLAIGSELSKVEALQDLTGDLAAWSLTAFGLLYMLWGTYRAYRNKPHKHLHIHKGELHTHEHIHTKDHDHMHRSEKVTNITPWILFVIFVLGPCESLIGIFIYEAMSEHGSISVAISASVLFSVTTMATMLIAVYLLLKGIKFVNLSKLERYTHALAGAVVMLSGLGIVFLGL